MRILGEMEGGFIVEISSDEVAKLRGYPSAWDLNYQGSHKSKVGMTYEISSTWRQVHSLREGREKLSKIAAELRTHATLLEYRESEINKEVENDATS